MVRLDSDVVDAIGLGFVVSPWQKKPRLLYHAPSLPFLNVLRGDLFAAQDHNVTGR